MCNQSPLQGLFQLVAEDEHKRGVSHQSRPKFRSYIRVSVRLCSQYNTLYPHLAYVKP